MGFLKKLDERYGNSTAWQFVKFNLVGYSISFVQLVLANILPVFFDSVDIGLPAFLQGIFDAQILFPEGSRYVKEGVVTWAYVLPFFLSNFIANIYGYYVNRNTVFKGTGSKKGIIVYFIILISLILFTTWVQGRISAALLDGPLKVFARTIAASAAGLIQVLILFPLEKYVLFK